VRKKLNVKTRIDKCDDDRLRIQELEQIIRQLEDDKRVLIGQNNTIRGLNLELEKRARAAEYRIGDSDDLRADIKRWLATGKWEKYG